MSRSYVKPIPIVTTYEPDLAPENATANQRKSIAGSTRAPTTQRAESIAPTIPRSESVYEGSIRPTEKRAPSVKAASIKAPSTKAPTINRPPSVAGSVRQRQTSGQGVAGLGDDALGGVAAGTAVGQIMPVERQRELQQTNNVQPTRASSNSRTSLVDHAPSGRDSGRERNATFDAPERATSPRPMSPFGHRPQPNLMSVAEDGRESRYDIRDTNGRDSRNGQLGRSGTVLSRANTLGRTGTLSRATNGVTVGNRRGAFGRGAGASVGTQPEEVLGRE